MKHLMVDIETTDTAITATILEMAFVVWDEDSSEVESLVLRPSREEQRRGGRTSSEDTLAWWKTQVESPGLTAETKTYLENLLSGNVKEVSIQEAHDKLTGFIQGVDGEFWAYGIAFDFPLVKNLFGCLGLDSPLAMGKLYRKHTCLRTYEKIAVGLGYVPFKLAENPHMALQDCYNQVESHRDISKYLASLSPNKQAR